jgi:hypothetical protein
VRPQLECLIAQAGQLDLLAVDETMAFADGEAHDFASDRPLANVFGTRRQRREREIASAIAQECADVAAEDLARVDLEERIVLLEAREQHRHGLEGTDERVDQAQRSRLAAGRGLHTPRSAIRAGEHTPAIGEEHEALGCQLDPPRAALEQGDAEQPFERLDLLAHRLLRDVELPRRAGEAALFGDGTEVAHLAHFGREHTSEFMTRNATRRQAKLVGEQQLALVRPADRRVPSWHGHCSRKE